ncbi:hypothetical protein TorRG33x02_116770 [Trema orientale]|uniref:Uncharacterized protein n=1 Tax=Trema orientale TaxID=63057 RepID=A0A2P5F463_TREOI|nr:hypothetical protein TorRG33x02_116770 [Trema orientale]
MHVRMGRTACSTCARTSGLVCSNARETSGHLGGCSDTDARQLDARAGVQTGWRDLQKPGHQPWRAAKKSRDVRIVRDNQKDVVDRYNDMLKEVLVLADRIKAQVASIEGDVSLLERVSVGPSSSGEKSVGSKLKVP